MSVRILAAAAALALLLATCLPGSALSGDGQNDGGDSARIAGTDRGKGVRRDRARIGNFKGGRLGASSFGDGNLPGQISADAHLPVPSQAGNPPGGFFSRYGSGAAGANNSVPPVPDSGNSFSRATIGAGARGDNDQRQKKSGFPTRVGNTETRQWEIGAGVPVDASYAYWANWGVNAGLLMEFGWGFPFLEMGMGMGMPGMMSQNLSGGNGYGPSAGYGYPGSTGAFGTGAYDPYGTTGARSDDSTNGTDTDRETSNLQANGTDPSSVGPAPQAELALKGDSSSGENAKVNVDKGEAEFRSGHYKRALYYWKHAVVDDPENGVLTMLLAQALLATGQYNDAAGATQAAMRLLPEDQWGVVVTNRRELYAEPRDYLDQLLALDKAAKNKPNEPALRFLAGFHYACLGYPKAALDNLDKGLKLAPHDELAQKLRDKLRAHLPKATVPPTPQPPAE